jgi:hypothetical protein
MCRNLWEFLQLQQGTDSVNEYIRKFNYLQQYGGDHVDTDDKKAELFRKGQSLPLQDHLVLRHDLSFDALVSIVIDQEGTYQALLVEEENMRKGAWSGPTLATAAVGQEIPPSLHSISWQVMNCTSTTIVRSSRTLAIAAASVTLDTCQVALACITSCTSVEDRSSQHPVLQLRTCWALCSAVT